MRRHAVRVHKKVNVSYKHNIWGQFLAIHAKRISSNENRRKKATPKIKVKALVGMIKTNHNK